MTKVVAGGPSGMSNENNQGVGTRSSFASRLLNKAISERKKTSETQVTTAEAAKFAVEEKEQKETATTIKG